MEDTAEVELADEPTPAAEAEPAEIGGELELIILAVVSPKVTLFLFLFLLFDLDLSLSLQGDC